MTKWEYRLSYSIDSSNKDGLKYVKDRDGWYLEYRVQQGPYHEWKPVRFPLNPNRDWSNMELQVTAWDEDAGYADLIMDVFNSLGKAGWEMVGFEGSPFGSGSYIFKRPVE